MIIATGVVSFAVLIGLAWGTVQIATAIVCAVAGVAIVIELGEMQDAPAP
jgi:hypothetical protein